jgi:hypothetical protein
VRRRTKSAFIGALGIDILSDSAGRRATDGRQSRIHAYNRLDGGDGTTYPVVESEVGEKVEEGRKSCVSNEAWRWRQQGCVMRF